MAGIASVPSLTMERCARSLRGDRSFQRATFKPSLISLLNTEAPAASLPIAQTSQASSRSLPTPIAQRIVIAFGPVRPVLRIQDLAKVATTGQVSPTLAPYLKLANLEPAQLQTLLTQDVTVNVVRLERRLRSLLGEYILYRVGLLMSTPSGEGNIQALRSAIVRAAADNNRISLIEFLSYYPVHDLVIDGPALLRLTQRLNQEGLVGAATARLEGVLLAMQETLAARICDCDT